LQFNFKSLSLVRQREAACLKMCKHNLLFDLRYPYGSRRLLFLFDTVRYHPLGLEREFFLVLSRPHLGREFSHVIMHWKPKRV
jgi:hypothetical protein